MTSRRDLGPVLAIAGGGVVVAAVIVGFVAVGGPGDARDQRLDNLTMLKIEALADSAQCVYSWSEKSFETVEELQAAVGKILGSNGEFPCRQFSSNIHDVAFGSGASPENPGDVSYALIDDSHIRVCGNFRRSFDPDRALPYPFGYRTDAPTEFSRSRPAGVYCYEIELVERARDPAMPAPSDPS
jgi:hypothetical protein